MHKDIYLVRITTDTGKKLYIDEKTGVWSEAAIEDIFEYDGGPIFFNDFYEARECAEMYYGIVVRFRVVIEPFFECEESTEV